MQVSGSLRLVNACILGGGQGQQAGAEKMSRRFQALKNDLTI